MHPCKSPIQGQKIDLTSDYPCPCRRKARLVPIVLTEALGCNSCPNVFVVQDEGDRVEQVAGLLLSGQVWRWTGQQWVIPETSQPLFDRVLVCGLIILMGVLLYLPGQWAVLGGVLGVLLCPMLVDALRRWLMSR